MKAEFVKYKKQLEEMRSAYLRLIEGIDSTDSATQAAGLHTEMRDSLSELSSYDNHPADSGSELFERSKDLALRDNAIIQLQKIEDALQKIADGTYGRCNICGQEIPAERLEAAPETTLCLDCRKEFEGEGDRHPRPIEEDVIVPPFGGLTHDQSPLELGEAEDEIMYDGEDAWQDVARFGTSDTPSDVPNAGHYPEIYYDFDEDVGMVDDVDHIPYEIGDDGIIYENFTGLDDEDTPAEKIDVGEQHH
jgi:YteA family regulatory protein